MKFKKIELARQTNFLLAVLLIHFIFFGYLANVYAKDIGEGVLFLYQVMFNPQSFLSLIILFAIVFFMAFREYFFEYGIRNSVWLIPVIMGMSWIWYWFITVSTVAVNFFDSVIYVYDISNLFPIIGMYFLRLESYLTILIILGINLTASILAAVAREKYNTYLTRTKKIEV
jgi:hypothetical protein